MSRGAGWLLFGPAAVWTGLAAAGLLTTAFDSAAWAELDRGRSEVVGSADCRRCHPKEHETWHRSYHRTMTQEARGEAVLAPFAGETVEGLGFVATMSRTSDGTPHVRVVGEAGPILDADVELTVGSHRYQQYVARIDRGGGPLERYRLPLAWHRGEARWIHLAGAFLTPDGPAGDADHYLRHLSRWNDNCIFCHNTEPVPGLRADGTFASTVGEIGIACEACHGPASAHANRHASPARRMLAAVASGDGSIANPRRMDAGTQSAVCGRCHGQRIGKDVRSVLAHGDGFVPGTDLAAVSRPIFRDARLASDPPSATPFASRFWPDGTPRLSAYEYQGLLLSACHADGRGIGCEDCHAMHGPNPDMQLRQDAQGDAVCRRCHPPTAVARDHGGHHSVTCQGCHMPRTTYGLLEGMISHRIANPDPGALVGRSDQPDACTQCHTDRSRGWAAAAMDELGLHGSVAGRPGPREAWAPRVALDLLGGDPIQRSLAAHALARRESPADPTQSARWATLALDDEYPVVRWFGWRAVRDLAHRSGDAEALALLRDFDYLGDPADRISTSAKLRVHLGEPALATDAERMAVLQASRDDQAIEIGE